MVKITFHAVHGGLPPSSMVRFAVGVFILVLWNQCIDPRVLAGCPVLVDARHETAVIIGGVHRQAE